MLLRLPPAEEIYEMTIKSRQTVLGFSVLINICAGFPYTWSVFAVFWAVQLDRELTELTLAFSLGTLSLNAMAIAGGRIQDLFGPVLAIRIGACLYCFGLIMCGFTSSLMWLYVFYGVVATSGIGLVYCAVLMNLNNTYPEKRGTVSGIATAAFGLHTVVFSPVADYLIGAFGLLNAYRIFGAFFFIILMFSSLFMYKAPVPAAPSERITETGTDKKWYQMMRTRVFYIIFLLMTLGAVGGLTITSQASIMAQTMAGASMTQAAFAVSLFAGANTAGRFVWGVLSDIAGRINALYCIFLFTALSTLCLSVIKSGQFVLFVILIMIIAFCYGGIMGTFPALVTEHFGSKNNGTNYGIVLQAVAVGSFIGPSIAAFSQTVTPGDFSFAFYITAALGAAGVVFTYVLKKSSK